MSKCSLHNFSDFPLYWHIPQMPTFPVNHKLDIDRIEYDAPNFISNGATPKLLADALERGFQGLGLRSALSLRETRKTTTRRGGRVMSVQVLGLRPRRAFLA